MAVKLGGAKDYSAMQGPCASGFHIPTNNEWKALVDAGIDLGAWTSSGGDNLRIYMKIPFAGMRYRNNGNTGVVGSSGCYSSCIAYPSTRSYRFLITSSSIATENVSVGQANASSIRAFKDEPVIPGSSWTTLYDGSSVATGAGIFHNATLEVISISADGQNWTTIADKNLGATTVYNNGNTLSEANCGKYYQRGNNYGFPRTGSVTTSSTLVDASNYGPGNYYNSSTFITVNSSTAAWSSVENDDLRGGVTGIRPGELQAAYIGEYGWHPGANTIAYRPLTATTTVNDQSGNGYNLTNAGEATWQTVDGVSCMYCNGNVSGTGYVYTTALTTPPTSITISIWSKASNDWSGTYARGLFDTNYNYSPQGNNGIRWEFYSGNGYPAIIVGNGGAGTPGSFNQLNYTGVNYSAIQSWTLWTVTYNGTTKVVNIYRNGTLATTKTITSYIPTTGWTDNLTLGVGWRDNSTNRRWKGWISETLLESVARTADEILNYYNLTKGTYGL